MKYCFYVQYRGQGGILRMLSQPALDDLPLYKTIDMKEPNSSDYSKHDDKGLRTVVDMPQDRVGQGIERAETEDMEKKQNKASVNEYTARRREDKGVAGTT